MLPSAIEVTIPLFRASRAAASDGGVTPRRRPRSAVLLLPPLLAVLASGCPGYQPVNPKLDHCEDDYGYRPRTRAAKRPMGDVLLVLAFSGGGTRAAAFSYGVLEELRDTEIPSPDGHERLLDEVDLITSVSGGSFTSAYFGLFGDRIFSEFEPRFLRKNIQRELALAVFNPLNWYALASPYYDRTDLAVELYDDEIFDHATFADLEAANGPFIQINAADLATGNEFTFWQPQFDLLCSDLSKVQVARAVAASSAVPGVFSALTFQSYAGTCGPQRPPWLDAALAERSTSLRRVRSARAVEEYLQGKRKYIHLVDGGVADNLGLRGPIESVILVGGIRARFEQLGASRPRYIVVVVVNAEVHPEPEFSLLASAPGLGSLLGSVSSGEIYSYNFETLELLRSSLDAWARALPVDARGRPVETYVVELAFESLVDPAERSYFNELPTSFVLDDEQVDRLIEVGKRLVRSSPEFQRFLQSIGTYAEEEHGQPAAEGGAHREEITR